jgi:lysophospholipase L1-like esterase
MGVPVALGHVLGDAIEEPVLILRFANWHDIWFMRGSRDLSHSYRSPSSGGDLGGSWDVIHFNFGVWDAVYRDENSKYYGGQKTTTVEDFEKNLRTIVAKLRKTGATLIWGNVTPIWDGTADKPNGDEDAYNRVAAKVMQENGVIINDLNAESRRQGYPKTQDVHSVGNLSQPTTDLILDAIAKRKNNTKPLPRVLLIGDSITGSYQGQVIKNLDGKAAVFKNPGNAESTWTGVRRMDEWLDLGQYLMNGQEYLELVDSIHKAMGEELVRICPEHAARGVELAGVIWFQGIQDGLWESKADAYEATLANFIRDFRKEFKSPHLPFVIVGLAGAEKMLPNQQKVFDAQMAMGDPEKYPEFKGTVISIDTRPMSFPIAECPGGRDRYKGHAGSYLTIGEAIGKAMLELRSTASKPDTIMQEQD